jgi:hypothetical protein
VGYQKLLVSVQDVAGEPSRKLWDTLAELETCLQSASTHLMAPFELPGRWGLNAHSYFTAGSTGSSRPVLGLFVRYVFLPVALLWAIVISGCGSLPSVTVPPTPTPAPLHVTVTGLVNNPLTLTTDNLESFRGYGRESTMVCPDGTYETEEATWQGVLLSDLFEAAGIRPEARKFTVYSDFDDYQQTFKLRELAEQDIFLAVTKDNRPMTFDEGAPARIVAHEEWGFRWVRWVSRIEVTE